MDKQVENKKKKISLSLAFAAIWMVVFMVLYTLKIETYFKIGIYLNLLFIVLVVWFTQHNQVTRDKKLFPFPVNFKNCLKASGKYFIIITAFLFVFLKFINPSLLTNLRDERIATELAKDWSEVQINTPIFADMTREEYIEKATNSNEILSSVSLNLSFYFLGMFFMSLFFSILVPLIYKKLVLRM